MMKKYISICVFALLLVFLAAPSISSAQTTVRCVSASGGAMGPVGGSAPVAGNQCDTTTGSIGTGSGTCQYQNSDLLMCVPPPSLCTDTNASNYNQPLPCTYPKLCTDTNASNYNQPLPC